MVTPTTAPPVNLRDVRGLRTTDGRIVRRGVLYRSEVPLAGAARAADVAVWPPATVLDLRMPEEWSGPHPLSGVAAVHSVPLGGRLAPALATARPETDDLRPAYRHLVRDAADAIAGIVELVAAGPGPVLVHCTAGKDRTGIVVAVLLSAAGVRRPDVLADYLRTAPNLPRLWARLRAAGVPEPANRALLGVQADALAAVLDEIAATPGGVPGWLAAHGAAPDAVPALRERLLSPVRAPTTAR